MKKILFFALFLSILMNNECNTTKQTENHVNIGVILPLTGELANFGNTVLNGIKLSIENFKATNTNLKINLVIEDSQGRPANAVSALNKIIDNDKTEIIIGSLTSSETLAMAPIANSKKIVLISPTASNPALSKSGPYFYRVWTSDDFDGKIAAQYCFSKLNLTKASIVYINNDYGLGLKNVFEANFENSGGKILDIESYNENETDFRTIITKLSKIGNEVIYIPGHPNGIGTFIKQAKEQGLNLVCFANVAAEDKDFLKSAGDAAAGLFFTSLAFDINSKDSIMVNFLSNYKQKYNEIPDVHAVKGHDATLVLLSGISRGYRSAEQLINYIDSTKTFNGVSGNFSFDKNGDVITDVAVKRYKKDLTIETVEVFHPTEY